MLDLAEIGGRNAERGGELGLLEAALGTKLAKAVAGEDASAGHKRPSSFRPFSACRSPVLVFGSGSTALRPAQRQRMTAPHTLQIHSLQFCNFACTSFPTQWPTPTSTQTEPNPETP